MALELILRCWVCTDIGYGYKMRQREKYKATGLFDDGGIAQRNTLAKNTARKHQGSTNRIGMGFSCLE